jgi:hypothetical protein
MLSRPPVTEHDCEPATIDCAPSSAGCVLLVDHASFTTQLPPENTPTYMSDATCGRPVASVQPNEIQPVVCAVIVNSNVETSPASGPYLSSKSPAPDLNEPAVCATSHWLELPKLTATEPAFASVPSTGPRG